MTRLPARFLEDRALRDAARAVLDEDIARLRASLDQQGVASRVSSSLGSTVTARIRAGAGDVLQQAKERASDHPGVLALLLGAILLWLMRGPLMALLEDEHGTGDGTGDGADGAGDITDTADTDASENGEDDQGDSAFGDHAEAAPAIAGETI